jgi:hypothetical protein
MTVNAVTFTIGGAANTWSINNPGDAQAVDTVTRSALDTKYLAYPVTALVGGAAYNPTADTVQFAFMPNPANQNPGSGDWHNGNWAATGTNTYLAQCLIGPANNGVVLAVGNWNVWIKITDNPEVPVQQVGLLTIT